MYVGVPTYPHPPPPHQGARRLTARPADPPRFGSTGGGGGGALQPLKRLNTPRARTVAGSTPRDAPIAWAVTPPTNHTPRTRGYGTPLINVAVWSDSRYSSAHMLHTHAGTGESIDQMTGELTSADRRHCAVRELVTPNDERRGGIVVECCRMQCRRGGCNMTAAGFVAVRVA